MAKDGQPLSFPKLPSIDGCKSDSEKICYYLAQIDKILLDWQRDYTNDLIVANIRIKVVELNLLAQYWDESSEPEKDN